MKTAAQPNPTFLKIAIGAHRDRLVAALRAGGWVKSAHFELAVAGLPEVETITLFVWPVPLGHATHLAIDIVRLDARRLREAIRLQLPLRPAERPVAVEEVPPPSGGADVELSLGPGAGAERPEVVKVAGPDGPVTWRLVAPGVEQEVVRLGAGGVPVFQPVDTAVFCYRLTCGVCGRVRYAKPNSLHQVALCRVCTRQDRLRRRAVAQYYHRTRKRRRR